MTSIRAERSYSKELHRSAVSDQRHRWDCYSNLKVARKYEVKLALDGADSGVHYSGKVFPIDVPNDEVVGFKQEILSFSTTQAMQSRRSDGNGAHFIRLSYAVTKRCVAR